MFGLPPFRYTFEVWKRTDCILEPTTCAAGETVSVSCTLTPSTQLRIFSSVECDVTVVGSTTVTYHVVGSTITDEVFTSLTSLVATTNTVVTLYAVDASHASRVVLVSKGQVLGAVFGRKRFLAVDEFGRLGTLEGQSIVCSPDVVIQPGDILKTPDGIWYEALSVLPAYDERNRLHHYELAVEAVTEDKLRLQ